MVNIKQKQFNFWKWTGCNSHDYSVLISCSSKIVLLQNLFLVTTIIVHFQFLILIINDFITVNLNPKKLTETNIFKNIILDSRILHKNYFEAAEISWTFSTISQSNSIRNDIIKLNSSSRRRFDVQIPSSTLFHNYTVNQEISPSTSNFPLPTNYRCDTIKISIESRKNRLIVWWEIGWWLAVCARHKPS